MHKITCKSIYLSKVYPTVTILLYARNLPRKANLKKDLLLWKTVTPRKRVGIAKPRTFPSNVYHNFSVAPGTPEIFELKVDYPPK